MNNQSEKWVLITGAAKRVGAKIAKVLHNDGFNIVIHYNTSSDAANKLRIELNRKRENSSMIPGCRPN